MKRLRCKCCNTEYEVDETNVTERYIQCPNCGELALNPSKT